MQGRLSAWLVKHGLIHRSLGFDYYIRGGIETLQIKSELLLFYMYNTILSVLLYYRGGAPPPYSSSTRRAVS